MTVFRALDKPEQLEVEGSIKRVTHEAYVYSITPFSNPPIRLQVFKGVIDKTGAFKPYMTSQKTFVLNLDQFKLLLKPDGTGKPSGDFRLSDILQILNVRPSAVVQKSEDHLNGETP